MTVFNVNGQQIHAVQEGAPNRQVALLIHGWSSSWYALSPLMPLLAQRFSVISVDLPGYGKSPRLPERTTIAAYADLLAALIQEVSTGPVVLVGHSMGGMISAVLAARYPALVERMVLLCPTISGR
ncbi:MAG: alpha/beta hydrolase, partial [Chloroflexota bacterium]